MTKGMMPLLAVAVLLFAGTAAGAEPLVLAERGRAADCAIIIPQSADETVRYAAAELRNFTDWTTGVKLPTVTDAKSGRSSAAPLPIFGAQE